MQVEPLLKKLGVNIASKRAGTGPILHTRTPIDGTELLKITTIQPNLVEDKIKLAHEAFKIWRREPAPRRGDLIRLFGEELRLAKDNLAKLVTIENGKILAEANGEVQEMIDICDFAVGLSRQLHGLTIASERPLHVMQEAWYPLGPVAIISAFNFPVAVFAWNFALALVTGNSVLWKPSEKTSLSALACEAIFAKSLARFRAEKGQAPENLLTLIIGDAKVAAKLVAHPLIALVSATGSTKMGQTVAPQVAARFGRSLLELGGNNAVIVSDKADLKLALSALLFGAVGTAGQRCTTIRRAFIQSVVFERVVQELEKAYRHIAKTKIGNPLSKKTLLGPLIDRNAYLSMQKALKAAKAEGGTVYFGNRVMGDEYKEAFYVEPALVRMAQQSAIVRSETFAPILYCIPYGTLEEAMTLHNEVSQGLSSAIFTSDLREAEYFRQRSDCGIANINIGTSGAEIGGAFGGEKETGGGRESGSDAWKNYMRRQTSTVFYGTGLPLLAQGINFDVD